MALPSSGTITLLQIQTEFSASDLVAAASAAGVPLPASLTDFYGLSAETLIIDGDTANVESFTSGGGATSTIEFAADGTGLLDTSPNGGDVAYNGTSQTEPYSFDWIDPTSAGGADYEIRVTATGDTGSLSGTTGSYLSLGSTRSWSVGIGSSLDPQASCELTITIREVANTLNNETMTATLTATPLA